MNTKSPFDFRWCIRVTGGLWIYIGIASKLQQKNTSIGDYDKNAILFSPRAWTVSKGGPNDSNRYPQWQIISWRRNSLQISTKTKEIFDFIGMFIIYFFIYFVR